MRKNVINLTNLVAKASSCLVVGLLSIMVCPAQALALSNTSEWPVTDFENTSIDVSEIMSGGPPKDGIPSIDSPVFETADTANDWLSGNEPVIALAVGKEAKAYPLQILTWHEIVNDKIADKLVTVTFCPLCNASIVFDRVIDGVEYDFGTTGRLRRSDMVMYDRNTESWWQQFTGQGIIGKMNGVTLAQIPSVIVSFDAFKKQYPNGEVLSKKTGYQRAYGRNPYPGYDDINSSPFLFRGPTDDRLPPMERVLSLRTDSETLLFGLSELKKNPVVNTKFGNEPVAVFSFESAASALDNGTISESRAIPSAAVYSSRVDDKELTFVMRDGYAEDAETGSQWSIFGIAQNGPLEGRKLQQLDAGVHFAFAWLAFDPDAEIYSH